MEMKLGLRTASKVEGERERSSRRRRKRGTIRKGQIDGLNGGEIEAMKRV